MPHSFLLRVLFIGGNLKIATEQVGWENVARSFTEVSGKKAVFKDITLDEYFTLPLFPNTDSRVGHSVGHDDATLQSYRQNFSGYRIHGGQVCWLETMDY
jgi:hypothetical protein